MKSRLMLLLALPLVISYIVFSISSKNPIDSFFSFLSLVLWFILFIASPSKRKTNEEGKPGLKYKEIKPQAAIMIPLISGIGLTLVLTMIIPFFILALINSNSGILLIVFIIYVIIIGYFLAVYWIYQGFKEYDYQKRNKINWREYSVLPRT